VSSKIRLSRLAGLWAQLSGVKWGLEPSKGVDADTAPGGLIMPKGREIEEI